MKRDSEAKLLTFAGFRDFFGGAGHAEARMSAALLGMGCIGQPSTQKYAMSDCPGIFGVHRTGLFRGGYNILKLLWKEAWDPRGTGI